MLSFYQKCIQCYKSTVVMELTKKVLLFYYDSTTWPKLDLEWHC